MQKLQPIRPNTNKPSKTMTCQNCRGTGFFRRIMCDFCQGLGYIDWMNYIDTWVYAGAKADALNALEARFEKRKPTAVKPNGSLPISFKSARPQLQQESTHSQLQQAA